MIRGEPRVAVRAWQGGLKRSRRRPRGKVVRPAWLLVFDTETTIDAAQRLRVGCVLVLHRGEPVEEALFYEHVSDDELELLRGYAADRELALLTIDEFRERFFQIAYRLRGTVVGFNLPFDLTRLALDWSPARGAFYGGWSLTLWNRKDGQGENRFRPHLRLKSLNNRAALIDFTGVQRGEGDGPPWRGRFLDLRTLAGALTDKGLSLDQAAETFATEHRKLGDPIHGAPLDERYLDYLRRDVLVTEELYEKVMAEYDRHPIRLDAADAYSSASIGKAYLEAFGITPMLERSTFTDDQLGYWISAFFGGRAECRIRREVVPVTYLDVRSMYPTVFTLMGLTRYLTAAEISCEDVTDWAQGLLGSIDLEDLFVPETWLSFPVLVEVEPDEDVLPVRMKYGGTARSIGVNYFTSNGAWWYSLCDAVGSKLLTERPPRIRRALRLTAEGQLEDLRTVELRRSVRIDPRQGELFKRAIEERHRVQIDTTLAPAESEGLQQFLKTFASGTSYGITAELNRKDGGKPTKLPIHSRRSFETRVDAIERPGRYCFPPLATTITGAARLVLAMLEKCVTDAGGSYVFMDTDSIAVVTDYRLLENNREARQLSERDDALSLDAVEAIVQRFASLNPYTIQGSPLKIEGENYARSSRKRLPLYAHAVSAKRYVLFNLNEPGEPDIRKHSEHGLGTYRSPYGDGNARLD